MNKISYYLFAVSFFLCSSCSTAKNPTKTIVTSNPFGDVYEVPAAEHDTQEYFGATGISYGSKNQMGELQIDALTNAQDIVRQKIKHAYKGMISNYGSTIGNNVGTNIQNKIERAGDQIIDAIVNDTQATKGPLFSNPDEKGNVSCYIGIRIYKDLIADKIADVISEDEEMKIRFNEEQYRKYMKEIFKEYQDSQRR